ncbi:MAG: hypothetical protein JWP35_4719 [Caulobacter sp.]|nr:hypothetical protein [Caulobacter sp.]
MIGSILLLAYVILARVGEMWFARRNTAGLMARGASEHAPGHYPFILVMHVAWLLGLCWLGWNRPIDLAWLAVFVLLQGLRLWVFATLGSRWTSRIITVPGDVLVTRGPYRFTRHPNYLVVIGEIAALPMVFGLWQFAIVFSILNAIALFVRIRAEDQALAGFRHG